MSYSNSTNMLHCTVSLTNKFLHISTKNELQLRSPYCSMYTPSLVPLQGLCTYCSLCLENSLQIRAGPHSHFIPIENQMSLLRDLLPPPDLKQKPIRPFHSTLSFLISPYSTYLHLHFIPLLTAHWPPTMSAPGEQWLVHAASTLRPRPVPSIEQSSAKMGSAYPSYKSHELCRENPLFRKEETGA